MSWGPNMCQPEDWLTIEGSATWAPDSRTVSFISMDFDPIAGLLGSRLRRMTPNASAVASATVSDRWAFDPLTSADGELMVMFESAIDSGECFLTSRSVHPLGVLVTDRRLGSGTDGSCDLGNGSQGLSSASIVRFDEKIQPGTSPPVVLDRKRSFKEPDGPRR